MSVTVVFDSNNYWYGAPKAERGVTLGLYYLPDDGGKMKDENYWYGAPKCGEGPRIDFELQGVECFKFSLENFAKRAEKAVEGMLVSSAISILERKRDEYMERRDIQRSRTGPWFETHMTKYLDLCFLVDQYESVIEDLKRSLDG
jgi:hypothetical protein